MSEAVSIGDFIRRSSEYLERVTGKGETLVLKRGDETVAEVRPASDGLPLRDLPAVLDSLPHLTPEELEDFARDIEEARAELSKQWPRDPWES